MARPKPALEAMPPPPVVQLKPALEAMRALGLVLEDHLQLLLPALTRLIAPGAAGVPAPIQEEVLATMQDLLPRMQLAGEAGGLSWLRAGGCPMCFRDLLPRMQLAGKAGTYSKRVGDWFGLLVGTGGLGGWLPAGGGAGSSAVALLGQLCAAGDWWRRHYSHVILHTLMTHRMTG